MIPAIALAPRRPTRCGRLGSGLVVLVLLTGSPASAATVIEPPALARCSGRAGDPCTARAIAQDADARRARAIALAAESAQPKKTFRPSPKGYLVVLQALLGVALLIGLGWIFSVDRRAIRWRPVIWGLALQVAFAFIVLNPVVGDFFFHVVDRGVRQLLVFAEAGTTFVLQGVEPHTATHVDPQGHWVVDDVIAGRVSPALKTIAFWVLPTIIFFSSLMTLLYHLGIMQFVVRGIAAMMRYMLGTSGAETLSCAANVFLGQTEAPLLVKPFVKDCTQSELMAIMVGGFATVAGGVLALYVAVLRDIPGIAGHLVAASFMGAPGALALSKLMYPETGAPRTAGGAPVVVERPDANSIEAVARGATEGMMLLLNVVAMLIAFVAMVYLANSLLGLLGGVLGVTLTLERILGWILSPLAWTMGVPWEDAMLFGELLGKKLVLTELLAYLDLQRMGTSMSERSAVMATYALCGFANLASIGIQIGGIGSIAPNRRGDLARLGLRAMFAGAMVSCLSATWAGMIYQLFRA
jgi:CNT family concentrative nucleoside transporter